jgi:hypothetical protein
MNTNKQIDIADMRDELAAEIKENEKERSARAWREKSDAEHRARNTLKARFFEHLIPHLPGATIDAETGLLRYDGLDVSNRVSLEEEWSRGYCMLNGKTRVVVDVPELKYNRQTGRNYEGSRRQSYPQRKDGTHNYAEIAKHIRDWTAKQNASRNAERMRKNNEEVAVRTRYLLSIREYDHFSIAPSSDADNPVFVKWSIQRSMTSDEAQELHAALKTLGLVT